MKMKLLVLYCYFHIFLDYTIVVSTDEVLGCGGYLKSHVPIDFSKVEVRLVTKQGIIKDKTTAAPNNGYYFVPLYDKGEMFLELAPPPGWSFEPQKVALSIDTVSELCNDGKDIDFIFQGFGITGRVESLGKNNKGPKGVTVKLESSTEERETTTDRNGQFFFTPVFPGTYKVTISHPKWKTVKQAVEVTVAESNAELPKQSLIIQGYDVHGIIKSEGQPVEGATIVLFSKEMGNKSAIDGCNTDNLTDISLDKKALCYVVSDEEGKYTFGTVPNGEYYVIPSYKSQNIYFQPEKIDFTVNDDSVHLKKQFEIVGFSVTGRVMRSEQTPIPNAKVIINNQEKTTTDSKGVYKLEKIKAGNYKIRVEYDDLMFEETVYYVNPSLQNLPDILPSAYKVCGSVTSDDSQTVMFSKIGSTQVIQTETSPKDGTFCQYLPLGKYDVQVIVEEKDKRKGLQFFPLVQKVEVAAEKIFDIVFSQLKTTIAGTVKCIKLDECTEVTVVLKGLDDNEITLKVENGKYSVSNMYPGAYEIKVVSDKFCWETTIQKVNVNSEIANIPPFIQKGYNIKFLSSHDTQVTFKYPGEAITSKLDIPKGQSSFCLAKPGEYKFLLSSCHSYESPSVTFRTNLNTKEIELVAKKHIQKLAIRADSDFGDLQVSIKIGTEQSYRVLKYRNELYELEVLLEPTETAVIVPHSDVLFFKPPILSIDGSSDCNNLGVKFIAVKGKLFKGKVIPPLAEVTVTVESSDSERLVIQTDENGLFKFPPLDLEKEYTITAKKESYVLTGPDQDGNFIAHKLAEVVVKVVDKSDKKLLTGVLLSLSGGESYRKNLQSGDDGKISFHSLSPGEYFLRPMMKEYIFEPNSKIITVYEGQTVNITLMGKRVAYSAFGQVESLNGEPEDDMVIIASGLNNCSHFSEETSCESGGQFRIRGLQPYCSYRIIVKEGFNGNGAIEGSLPEFIDIENIQNDVKNLKLVVFRPVSHMDILVKVFSANVDYYKHLRVKLVRQPGSVVVHTTKVDPALKFSKSINPGVMLHIPSIHIDNNRYSLHLDSSVISSSKREHQPYHFIANTSFIYVELEFDIINNLLEQPIRQTSIWSLIFVFAILFAVYNIDFIGNFLRDKFNFNIASLTNIIPIPISNSKNVSDIYDDAQIDQIVQSINNAKKKSKPKKA